MNEQSTGMGRGERESTFPTETAKKQRQETKLKRKLHL